MKEAILLALALVSSTSAARCSSAQIMNMTKVLATNVTAACANSLNMNATIGDALANPYGLCQPACTTDLSNLASDLPACYDAALITSTIGQISNTCTSLANPTTNGGTCTMSDMMAFMAVLKASVWANCSTNTNATVASIAPTSPAAVQALCTSATCTEFISSMAKSVPDCSKAGETPSKTFNMKSMFQMMFGCTPAAAGAPCAMIDLGVVLVAGKTPVWANCSTFLNLPEGAMMKDVVPKANATAETLPAGYCTSTCPLYVLSVMRALPSCTLADKNVSNTTALYTLCPNVKPTKSAASAHFMWSYVALLVTAVVALL